MKGYPVVDYDPAVWMEIPPFWGTETWPDHRTWARGMSEAVWKDSCERPGEYEIDNLALALAMCAEGFGPNDDDPHETFLHLPHPRADVLPVLLYVETDVAADLRDCVSADIPEALNSRVHEFPTADLGTGLRHRFDRTFPDDDAGPVARLGVLRFAWRLTEPAVTLILTTSAPDPALVDATSANIDELARAITWQSEPTDG